MNQSTTPKPLRDERQTPRWLFDYAVKRFGRFEVDLAANRSNRLCPEYFDRERDALAQRWSAIRSYDSSRWARGWCNPPYSAISPWMEKAIGEALIGFETIMLIPTPNGEKRDRMLLDHAVEIEFIIGRVHFPVPAYRGLTKREPGNERGSCFARFAPGARSSGPRISYVLRSDIEPPRPPRKRSAPPLLLEG